MKKLLMAMFALALLTACSSEPPKPAEKPQPKPPELLAARSGLQKLYISAHGWAPDARPYRLESVPNADSKGREGKSATWRASFASATMRDQTLRVVGFRSRSRRQSRLARHL